MSYNNDQGVTISASVEEAFNALSTYGVAAIRFQKLSNQELYHQQVAQLAKFCAVLIQQYSVPMQQIISHINSSINKTLTREVEQINADIKYLFNKRKKLSADSSLGEQEIAKLSIQIAELEKNNQKPSKQSIQNIIHDTIEFVSKNAEIDIPDEMYVNLHADHLSDPYSIPTYFNVRASLKKSSD